MAGDSVNSYDQVPYPSHPFPQTHPEHLAAVGHILGLRAAPAEHSRVLELGCARGGNLIPMAATMPESQFVGIDLSSRQIDEARKTTATLELTNIEFLAQSILDVSADLGQFDFIICHGVFSWVPREVQEKILEICARQLTANGLAYVSYNTYPGWHMHGMIRDIMHYHSSHFPDPGTRVGQSRALLDFLVRTVPAEGSPYGMLLRQVVEDLRLRSDAYLLHEHLDDVNDPIYFHEFVERATRHGLQYLAESEMSTMMPVHLTAEATGLLNQLAGDVVHLQQYLDFLKNTRFRQSLLCRPEQKIDSSRHPERLFDVLISTPAEPMNAVPDLRPGINEVFKGPHGSLTTATPMVKVMMAVLAEAAPKAVPFMELFERARSRLSSAGLAENGNIRKEMHDLASSLLDGYLSTTLLEFHTWQPRFVTVPSEKPVASPFARLQAQTSTAVTNVLHWRVGLHLLHQHLIRYLDGTRDQKSLTEALVAEVKAGILSAMRDGQSIKDEQTLTNSIEEAVVDGMKQLGRRAFLIA